MRSLFVALDVPESKKNNFFVLKTYYTGKLTIGKTGKYKGGSIAPANVLECDPISNADCVRVKELFRSMCFPVSYNAYYVAIDDFRKLHGALNAEVPFFQDNTDKTLIKISSVTMSAPCRGGKKSYAVDRYDIIQQQGGLLAITVARTRQYEIKIEPPVPELCYDRTENIYSLYFKYGATAVLCVDKRLSVAEGGTIYLRNVGFEVGVCATLAKLNLTKLAQGRFVYSGRNSPTLLHDNLAANGVSLVCDEEVIVPRIKVARGDSDWFEIDLACEINGEVIDLASKMDLFVSSGKIVVGGQKVVLPESIASAKNNISIEGGHIKLRKENILQLLRIAHESATDLRTLMPHTDISLRLPTDVASKAYQYQIDGIRWLKFLFMNNLGGCLADDMGLGKTFQAIALLSDKDVAKSVGKVLIIAPKSLLTNWCREFERFLPGCKTGIYHGESRSLKELERKDVLITTYNTAYLDLDYLNSIGFGLIFFDEIQMVKNHKGVVSDAMKELNAKVKFGISGTPMENNVSELWNVMDIVNKGMFSSLASFLRRYNGRNYDELKTILDFFVMRRMKKDVLKQLPDKTEEIIFCDMDRAQRTLYVGINVAVKKAMSALKAFAAPVVLKGLSLLRQCCCDPRLIDKTVNHEGVSESCKMDALKMLIANLFSSGHKILVFSTYVSLLQLVKNELDSNAAYVGHVFYLDGETKNRSETVNDFEKADEGIFLISIKAGGVGLNLVSAHDVIIVDPWWNPFVEQQAIDRAHRIGQKNPVSVYKLVVANTIEEKIVDMQRDKARNFNELLNGISADKNMNMAEIIALL